MPKLKLGAIEDDKPVKVTIELPAIEPAKLIAPMLARFMATDRVFARTRRAGTRPSSARNSALPES